MMVWPLVAMGVGFLKDYMDKQDADAQRAADKEEARALARSAVFSGGMAGSGYGAVYGGGSAPYEASQREKNGDGLASVMERYEKYSDDQAEDAKRIADGKRATLVSNASVGGTPDRDDEIIDPWAS